MNTFFQTNRPDRFERLESELLRGGHEIAILPVHLQRKHQADAAQSGPPSGAAGSPIDLAIRDLVEGEDPAQAWDDLCDSLGRPSIGVALLETRDLDRANAAFDAGFDEVLYEDCIPDGSTVRRWERVLARLTGSPSPSRRQFPNDARSNGPATEASPLPDEGALFRAALRDTNVFVVSVDRELRLTWIGNARPGFPAEEILGKRPGELGQVEDIAELEAMLREAISSGAPILREVRTRIQERARRQLVHAVPRQGPGGETVAVDIASIDITELREAQEALERAQAQYKLLEELSPDQIWAFRSPEDLDYINPRWEETLGRGIEDLHAGRWDRFIHPDDLPGLRVLWARAWEDGHPFSYELRLKVRDGSYRWFWARSVAKLDEQGRVVKVVGVTSDIEERKRSEIILRESEERFRDLANNITQMVWMNDAEGAIFWTNRRWIEYTGMPIDEIKEKGWGTVNHPDHVDRVVGGFYAALQRGDPWEDTFPLRGKDGGFRWFLTRVVPIRDDEGRIARWVGTNTDVTEQREAMEAAERSRAQLEAVLQSVQDGITVADMQGRIVFLNKVHGWVRELDGTEIAQHPFTHYRDALELEEMDGTPVALEDWPIARIIRGDTISEWLLKRRNKRTGEEKYFVYSGQPVRNERGEPILAVLITRDVTTQRRAEEKLRETNALLQAILESSQDTIFAKDRSGRLLMINSAPLEVLNRTMDQVIGKTELEFYDDPPSARAVMENDRRIMESGRAETIEETVRFPDGTRRTWLSAKSPLRDAAGRVIGLLGISRDITERKRAEEAVRRERELLDRLIDHLPVMVTILDTRTSSIRLNEEFRHVLGWSEEDTAHGDLFALAFPDPGIREYVRNLMVTSAPGWHDLTPLSKEGAAIPTSWAYLMTDGIRVGIGIDLRERKRAEEALRESEEKFRALAESLPQIVWTADSDGTVDYCNRRWAEYTGAPVERGHGRGWAEVLHPDDEQRSIEAWTGAARLGSVYVCEQRIRRHDSAFHWFLSRGVPMQDAQGRVIKWFGTSTDIDDQKRAQEELSRARDELDARVRERTSELEAQAHALQRSNAELQRFAYLASHDLQEPLRIVVSYAQLLANRYSDRAGPEAQEFTAFMTSAAQRMGQLIDDLLAYSHVESEAPRLERVEMAACVRQAIAHRQDHIRSSGAEIAVGPLPAIRADESLLCRLLDQLLGNALKFRRDQPPRISISAAQEGDQWIFSVRDNGIGIPGEFHTAIFEPFRRLHLWDEYPGTGIGLAICRRIVESHGGRIWVESAEDGGSVFRFAIPANGSRAENRPGEQTGEPGSVHEQAR